MVMQLLLTCHQLPATVPAEGGAGGPEVMAGVGVGAAVGDGVGECRLALREDQMLNIGSHWTPLMKKKTKTRPFGGLLGAFR